MPRSRQRREAAGCLRRTRRSAKRERRPADQHQHRDRRRARGCCPGSGKSSRRRIIAYREQNGPFRSVDDLIHVQGISDRTIDRFRDLVTTGHDRHRCRSGRARWRGPAVGGALAIVALAMRRPRDPIEQASLATCTRGRGRRVCLAPGELTCQIELVGEQTLPGSVANGGGQRAGEFGQRSAFRGRTV